MSAYWPCRTLDECTCWWQWLMQFWSFSSWSELRTSFINVPTCLNLILLVKMPILHYLSTISLLQPLTPLVVHSSLSGFATFLSRNQLSRHSMRPPLPTPLLPSGWSPVSLSHLLLSSYSTDHACSKNRSHFHPRYNPPPNPPSSPCTTTLLHYLLSKCPQFLSKSTISPPHCSTSSPTRVPQQPPHPMLEFGGVCRRGVHQSWAPWWYKTLNMYVLIRSFCQTSTPELEGATLLGEGGGPRVKTAENNKK